MPAKPRLFTLVNVSILIPCYNSGQWISKAILSALNQTYPIREIIVIDDGSTDSSRDIIQGFGDAIQWEAQHNQGSNAARNRLLDLSTGDWIQYLDADDYLLPDKIEKQVNYLESLEAEGVRPDVLYSPSILEFWDETAVKQEILPIPEPHDPWILLARWYLPQTGSPLWRKQAIVDVGGWNPDQPCCQEHELYLRLLKAGKDFQYCPHAGSVYRQWSNSTLCKRDMRLTWEKRLEIEQNMEDHLAQVYQMTPERQWAINQARFECARVIWPTDLDWANRIMDLINDRDRQFCPHGPAAPLMYRLAYRLAGFEGAEQFADQKRRVFRWVQAPLAK